MLECVGWLLFLEGLLAEFEVSGLVVFLLQF